MTSSHLPCVTLPSSHPQSTSVSTCLSCHPHPSFHSLPIILPFTQYRWHAFETHQPTLQECTVLIWGSQCHLQHTCPIPAEGSDRLSVTTRYLERLRRAQCLI